MVLWVTLRKIQVSEKGTETITVEQGGSHRLQDKCHSSPGEFEIKSKNNTKVQNEGLGSGLSWSSTKTQVRSPEPMEKAEFLVCARNPSTGGDAETEGPLEFTGQTSPC